MICRCSTDNFRVIHKNFTVAHVTAKAVVGDWYFERIIKCSLKSVTKF